MTATITAPIAERRVAARSSKPGHEVDPPDRRERGQGRWSTLAARSPRSPAGRPAIKPHIISGPTTGDDEQVGRAARRSGSNRRRGIATGATPELRRDRDPERFGEPGRTGTPVGDGAGEQQDAERRPDREPKADRPDEERVDEHEAGDREGQQSQPRRRTT